MKIDFYLMSEKGLGVLQHIIKSGNTVLINKVYVGRDSNILHDYAVEICDLCKEQGISCCLKGSDVKAGEADYSIAISWRWLIYDIQNLIVIHDSLLPKYRGFAPLVAQLINGENTIGTTAIWAAEDYDTGNVIRQSSTPVTYPLKISEAITMIVGCYCDCVEFILNCIRSAKVLPSIPQEEAEASYSLWRDEEDYFIDWLQPAEKISRFIDAVGPPYNGARTLLNGKEVIISSAMIMPDVQIENRTAGKVLRMQDGFPVVVCGTGLLLIKGIVDNISQEKISPFRPFRSRFKS